MLALALSNDKLATPCYFTYMRLPSDINVKRYPKKRKPFSTIAANPQLHTLDVLLPDAVWRQVQSKLLQEDHAYHQLTMRLLDIISGDFFNDYIKTGNISMISEGRPLVDNRFHLREGILRLELDKPTYERCGLVGKPMQHAGRKHVQQRFMVEIDLRQPSMVRGKKGFERVVSAFTKVLIEPVNWLFVDLTSSSASGPVTQVDGQRHQCKPEQHVHHDVLVPFTNDDDTLADMQYQEELLEWLGLAFIGSPRISSKDKVDPHICRYELPQGVLQDPQAMPHPETVKHLRWHGLLTNSLVMKILWSVKESQGQDWFVMSGQSFEGNAYTVLFGIDAKVLVWEMA